MCSTFSATNGFRPVGICLDARTYKHLPMTNHRKTIPTLKVEDNSAHSNDIKHAHVCNSTARPPARDSSCHVREAPNLMTRADVLNTMAAVVGVLTINAASSTAASRTAEELVSSFVFREKREKLLCKRRTDCVFFVSSKTSGTCAPVSEGWKRDVLRRLVGWGTEGE